jgi:hypothetical protein
MRPLNLALVALVLLSVSLITPQPAHATTYTVNTLADSGPGSLRTAMMSVVAGDTIAFGIMGAIPQTIAPLSALPMIVSPRVVIDGTTQPGYTGTPYIEIDGSGLNGLTSGVHLSEDSCTVRGLSIYGFDFGIRIAGNGATIESNYIGVDASGTTAPGNSQRGIWIERSSGHAIGGATVTQRNVIAGNAGDGIYIEAGPNNRIQGNYIGVDAKGAGPLGNARVGINLLNAMDNTIGGSNPGEGNVISNSADEGIFAWISNGTVIQGNFIGTDATGTVGMGNAGNGIYARESSRCQIGGSGGKGNIVSDNGLSGVRVSQSTGVPADSNIVAGNLIGTDITGTASLGNGKHGVEILAGRFNSVGGPGSENVIAYQTGAAGGGVGVLLIFGIGNMILSNSIHSNASLGIDLGDDGVTANDSLDPDTGTNNLQNFPVIDVAHSSAITSSTTINGRINATPSADVHLDFFRNAVCDSSNHGEGDFFLGSDSVTTDANGDAAFSVTFPFLSVGSHVTATATTGDGTSEFSECAPVQDVTAVALARFDVGPAAGGIRIEWAVASADGLRGFNMYRSATGAQDGFEKLNGALVAPDRRAFTDLTVEPGKKYWYRLGAVDRDGEFFSHTLSATAPAARLALEQNRPNPFNPRTRIRYSVPTTAHVTLTVYDVSGRFVDRIVDGTHRAGPHEVEWDATGASSGIYFYRLEADGVAKTRRMIFLK